MSSNATSVQFEGGRLDTHFHVESDTRLSHAATIPETLSAFVAWTAISALYGTKMLKGTLQSDVLPTNIPSTNISPKLSTAIDAETRVSSEEQSENTVDVNVEVVVVVVVVLVVDVVSH